MSRGRRSVRHRLSGRWALLAGFVLLSLSLAAGLGLRDPSPPDEPRFVLAARGMVDTGQWLVPRRGHELYAEKPPVFMWMQAAVYQLVGDWRVAFLLPSLLAALLTLALTWDLARRLWSMRVAAFAAAGLWACVQFGLQAKRAQIDMVLVALTTLSLWALVRHLMIDGRRRWLLIGGFAAGVGTVTKGVGFLPLLMVVPWYLHRRRYDAMAGPCGVGDTWVLAASFGAGLAVWLVPLTFEVLRSGDPQLRAYAGELLLRQTGERYANAWHHVQPAWYYLQVIVTLWLPGALLLPWLVPAWWRAVRAGDQATWLLVGWALLVLVFFCLSPGKREVYIFPALPALCVAAAPFLPVLLQRKGVQRALAAYVAAVSLVLVGLGTAGLAGWSDWALTLAAERDIPADRLATFLRWLAGTGAFGLVLLSACRLARAGVATVVMTGAVWTAYGLGLAPAVDESASARTVMHAARRHIGHGAEMGLIAWREQNLLQAVPPVAEFGFKAPWRVQWHRAQQWAAANPRARWIFFLEEAASPCIRPGASIPVGQSNRRQWRLVRATALIPGCVTPELDDEPARRTPALRRRP